MGTHQFLSRADEPIWVRGYFSALQAYLETQGVGYLDLAHDARALNQSIISILFTYPKLAGRFLPGSSLNHSNLF